jgi:thioredoxin reductase (NADPH)
MATDDVIVVGAGPAGLAAALYLARYRRSVRVLHDGTSRALRIPLTHNAPGFPEGIDGLTLIARMTEHAQRYGARLQQAKVLDAVYRDGLFHLDGQGGPWRSRALILATGVSLNQVDLPPEAHEAAIRAGVLRYCPICDGYEAIDKAIGVIGCDRNGAGEALFLRRYSERVTLLPLSTPKLSRAERAALKAAGVVVEHGALQALQPSQSRMRVRLEGRDDPLDFDVVYPGAGHHAAQPAGAGAGHVAHRGGVHPAALAGRRLDPWPVRRRRCDLRAGPDQRRAGARGVRRHPRAQLAARAGGGGFAVSLKRAGRRWRR